MGQALGVLPSNGFRKVPNDEKAVQAKSDLLHHPGHGVRLPGVPVPLAEPGQPLLFGVPAPTRAGTAGTTFGRRQVGEGPRSPQASCKPGLSTRFSRSKASMCSGFEARRPPCPGLRRVLPCGGDLQSRAESLSGLLRPTGPRYCYGGS